MNSHIHKQITELEAMGYVIDYCEQCEGVIIICPKCKNMSCNGGGCDYCCRSEDRPFIDFYETPLGNLTKSELDNVMFERISKSTQ